MLRAVVPAFALISGLVVGCAGTVADDGGDVGVGEAAATTMRWYDCNTSSSDIGDQTKRLEVGISPTTLKVVDVSKDAAPPDSGTIDPSYRPTPSFAGAVRYSGFPNLVALWSDVGSVDLIVSKELQENPTQGKIWLRTAGSGGGGSTSYFCRSKAKPFTVESSRRSRLACNLHLVCTDDNPPGETCLDSAFINQTSAAGATLRTKYLDHFGVHVQERQVNVGPSSALARTGSSFSAAWAGNKLDLTYRAGVTYVGTFKLPDGRSTEAQCNDLAMFD
jgi:hypothetical protein